MNNLLNINNTPQPSAKASPKATQGFSHPPAKQSGIRQPAQNQAEGKAHKDSSFAGKENANPVAQKNIARVHNTSDTKATAGKSTDAQSAEPFSVLLARQIDGADVLALDDSAQATIAIKEEVTGEEAKATPNSQQDPAAITPEAALAAMLMQLPPEKRPPITDAATDNPVADNGKTSGINIAAFNAAIRSDSSAAQQDLIKPDAAQADSVKQAPVKPDAAQADSVKQAPVKPDAAQADSVKLAPVKPDAAQADSVKPDSTQLGSAKPGLITPDSVKPVSGRPELVGPDLAKLVSAKSDSGTPDSIKPGLTKPDPDKPGLVIADRVSAAPEKVDTLAMMPDKQAITDVLTRGDVIKQAELPPGLLQQGASNIAHAINSPALSAVMPNMQFHNSTAGTQQRITTPLGANGWADDFSQKVSWISTQRNQVAELHLNPPDLGPLNVVLKISDNQATALFTSPHTVVREAIENALPRLREALADNGITLGNATVSDQPPRDRGREEFMDRSTGSPSQNEPSHDTQLTGLPTSTEQSNPIRRHLGMVDTFA